MILSIRRLRLAMPKFTKRSSIDFFKLSAALRSKAKYLLLPIVLVALSINLWLGLVAAVLAIAYHCASELLGFWCSVSIDNLTYFDIISDLEEDWR